MDKEAMVAEICKRVQERIAALGLQDGDISSIVREVNQALPGLLILTAEHGNGERCHPALECEKLNAQYRVECALLKEYKVDMADYETVIAYTLTNENLGKLANGIFDDDYTKLFGQALLSGKKIYIPEEEVELYQYKDQAPAVYYQKMEANLKLLKDSGVVIAPNAALPGMLLTGEEPKAEPAAEKPAAVEEPKAEASCTAEREVTITKRLITEGDIRNLQRVDRVIIDNKALLTDLAKELAAKAKITILRDDVSGKGRSKH